MSPVIQYVFYIGQHAKQTLLIKTHSAVCILLLEVTVSKVLTLF